MRNSLEANAMTDFPDDIGDDARRRIAEAKWHSIDSAPDGVEVETKIDDGRGCRNEQSLTRKGRLWFFPDMSMYVYYTPTHWRHK